LYCTTAHRMPTARFTWGTRSTKILKDMIVKARQLKGMDAAYIPGWDLPRACRSKTRLKRSSAAQAAARTKMQAKSRAYATEPAIDLQRADFKRLGVLGDWDHPYRTMDFSKRGR